ncbi:MAG: hypothetical protein JRI25_10790 [Deltaproteobacteria bacterium]|nr:hypothetical protein [Deltaproteobacteria bacterium]
MRRVLAFLALGMAVGCSDRLSSDEEAELAYLGLDVAIERALNLGMDGYNAASSANIPAQEDDGDVSGTMTITGQVDQGASNNKELRLEIALEDYSDFVDLDEDEDEEVAITYDTEASDLPQLDLSLRNIPDGTLEGTLVGTFLMIGDLEGEVALDLDIAGEIENDGAEGLQRVTGTTTVIGTATSESGGIYEVDIIR